MKRVARLFALMGLSVLVLLCLTGTRALAQHGGGGHNGPEEGTQNSTTTITLNGPDIDGVTPTGHATFVILNGLPHSFTVEAEYVNLPDYTLLTVQVNGSTVGTLILYAGRGELQLVAVYYGGNVPSIHPGDEVDVTDPDGNIVVSGQF